MTQYWLNKYSFNIIIIFYIISQTTLMSLMPSNCLVHVLQLLPSVSLQLVGTTAMTATSTHLNGVQNHVLLALLALCVKSVKLL